MLSLLREEDPYSSGRNVTDSINNNTNPIQNTYSGRDSLRIHREDNIHVMEGKRNHFSKRKLEEAVFNSPLLIS